MRKLTKKYRVHLAGWLLLLALLPVSCIKDDYAPKDKATVTVTFTTRAESETTVIGDQLAENERMQTLRVIVAKGDRILYNEYYDGEDFSEYENGQRYKTVTFSELVTEDEADRTFDFYAIANEAGIANWPTQITSLEQLPEDITLSTTSDLIPQTAKQSIIVKIPQEGSGIQKETMQLEFAVAKVRLTINNTSTAEQTVSNIKLSGLNMTSTPLFAGIDLSDVSEVLELGNMTISAGKSATVYAYFYENQNTDGYYRLTAYWNDKEQTLLLQTGSDDNKQTITEIPRGQMLDINVTLNADVDIEPAIKVQVNEWDEKKMEVPAFE